MNDLPFISDELLEYLSKMFPDRCPTVGTPLDEVWYQAGQASVVRHLRIQRDQIHEAMLDGKSA